MVRTRGAPDAESAVHPQDGTGEPAVDPEGDEYIRKLRKRGSDGSGQSSLMQSPPAESSQPQGSQPTPRCDSAAGSVTSVEPNGSFRGHESDESFKPERKSLRFRNAYRDRLEKETAAAESHYWSGSRAGSSSQAAVRRSTRDRRQKYDNMNEDTFLRMGLRERDEAGMKRQRSDSSDSEASGRRMSYPIQTRHTRRSHPSQIGDDVNHSPEDMYTRIKSKRRCVRGSYNVRIEESASDTEVVKEDELSTLTVNLSDSEKKVNGIENDVLPDRLRPRRRPVTRRPPSSSDEEVEVKKYDLRPKRFSSGIGTTQDKPLHRRRDSLPARMGANFSNHRSRFRRRPTHNISSSDSDSSSDEGRFERKKNAKMAKARNLCLPLNFKRSDLMKGSLKDRVKVGASLADIEPMTIDTSITFDSIGGLASHLNSLKEMIIFPLLYPEVFDRFKVQVPRGVLFHGPPGTGKTLVARALANECSVQNKKVAFFMRKGADCMSKWVGESERQLRLLFDQAYTMRPSIIFFDEIDGIAPVRSTRQDQIHSSIVSTLLALMDGLDSRGEVIVIGATNRIEAIDPALRRPGRFDREFFFPLPSEEARKEILTIHTKEWNPRPGPELISTLAARTVGYCGADLKALCSEAVLLGLKKSYRQIYSSKNKLQLDMNSIEVTLKEFSSAINRKIVPASQRSMHSIGKQLPLIMRPILQDYVSQGMTIVKEVFPGVSKFCNPGTNNNDPLQASESDEIDEQLLSLDPGPVLHKGNNRSLRFAGIFRPRLLVCGEGNVGQVYVASAILQELEQLHLFKLDSTRTTEELTAWFSESLNRLPRASVIYVPKIESLHDALFDSLTTLLDSMDPTMPLLFLATADSSFDDLQPDVADLFAGYRFTARILDLKPFSSEDRKKFYQPLFEKFVRKPLDVLRTKTLECLPEVPVAEVRKLSDKELSRLRRKEQISLRQLRNFLRDVLGKIIRDKRFSIFVKPVDTDEVEDYLQVIEKPMDLETMMFKIDSCQYESAAQFLDDIELITNNALEYNPNRDSNDKQIRHRACSLRDFAYAIIDAEMESDFELMCQEMHKNRVERGETSTDSAPKVLQPAAPSVPVITTAASADPQKDDETEVESNHSPDTKKDTSGSSIASTALTNGIPNGVDHKNSTGRRGRFFKKRKGGRQPSSVTSPTVTNGSEQQSASTESSQPVEAPMETTANDSEDSKILSVKERQEAEAPIEQLEPENSGPEVVINETELNKVLEEVVASTDGCDLASMENLYWHLFRTITKRIKEKDRTQLLEELRRDISDFRKELEKKEIEKDELNDEEMMSSEEPH